MIEYKKQNEEKDTKIMLYIVIYHGTKDNEPLFFRFSFSKQLYSAVQQKTYGAVAVLLNQLI